MRETYSHPRFMSSGGTLHIIFNILFYQLIDVTNILYIRVNDQLSSAESIGTKLRQTNGYQQTINIHSRLCKFKNAFLA